MKDIRIESIQINCNIGCPKMGATLFFVFFCFLFLRTRIDRFRINREIDFQRHHDES
jgi:hypothetical protein